MTPPKTLRFRVCVYSLVGANTGSFQSFRAQLLVLVGNQVDAEREFVNVRTLSAEIKDTDLRARNGYQQMFYRKE